MVEGVVDFLILLIRLDVGGQIHDGLIVHHVLEGDGLADEIGGGAAVIGQQDGVLEIVGHDDHVDLDVLMGGIELLDHFLHVRFVMTVIGPVGDDGLLSHCRNEGKDGQKGHHEGHG